MKIYNQIRCPSCNFQFSQRSFINQTRNTIQLDQNYQYVYSEILCNNCKQEICLFYFDTPILWRKKDQYSYSKFLKIKKNTKILHNNFLYLYYPSSNNGIIKSMCKYIDFKKFDSIITTQDFGKKLLNLDVQLCVIPNYLFSNLNNNIFPNYFVQKIILRHSEKLDQPNLYSTYYTFFNCFQLLYIQNNWDVLKKHLKQHNAKQGDENGE